MRSEPPGLSDWGLNRRENRAKFVGDALRRVGGGEGFGSRVRFDDRSRGGRE
jgi:hypothetical protein